ncbi:MAG: adenylate/guanylate cyclase domain-containing protein, partial [Caldimicrobium sp.]|nr:adenylate/guanylate cyclase domain-containing protein [Caldimicrobium sp.]
DEVRIVAIDERSIERLGRWPWSRDKIALLVRKLANHGASVIALDIIYSERERHDAQLAKSFFEAGNVFLPVVFLFDKKDSRPAFEVKPIALLISEKTSEKFIPIHATSVLSPLPEFIEASAGLVHINIFPDPDGVVRWESLYIEYFGYLVPSLSLRVSAYHLGIPEDKLFVIPGEGIVLGKRILPTDPSGRILIPYYGGINSFKHLSVVDILEDRVSRQDIEGKIVLVGATAVGIYDLRVTPTSPVMPGVEKHAHVIASILENRVLIPAPAYWNYLLIFGCGLIGLLFVKLRSLYSLFVLVTVTISLFGGAFYLFKIKGIWLPVVGAFFNLVFQFFVLITIKYAFFEREAKFIRNVFSSYVTERVVQELIKNPEMAKLGGERKEVTVFFSDLRGFTSMSEKLDPEKVVEILNEYFSAMTEIVFKWEGTLDKFIGDAIMVFWGAPIHIPDHGERAVRCAVEMVQRLRELNNKWRQEGRPELYLGAGIHTGQALVGNIGAEGKKMDYTVIGDTVNLASRLEGLNKQYNSEIIISEATFERVKPLLERELKDVVEVIPLGETFVKGKEKPIRIYQIKVL